jgi:hypothetical protein
MKRFLLKKLKRQHVFWSYDASKISFRNIPDEVLITKTFTHLDLSDINLLFMYYKPNFIKKVWREQMAISGEYLWTFNRFFAWYYFGIKKPDRYLKTIENKHIKKYD